MSDTHNEENEHHSDVELDVVVDKVGEEEEDVEGEEEVNDNNEDNNDDDDSEASESEYEEIDLTDNPLYQVLSAFFETEDGDNLCDILAGIKKSIDTNNQLLKAILVNKNGGSKSKRRH